MNSYSLNKSLLFKNLLMHLPLHILSFILNNYPLFCVIFYLFPVCRGTIWDLDKMKKKKKSTEKYNYMCFFNVQNSMFYRIKSIYKNKNVLIIFYHYNIHNCNIIAFQQLFLLYTLSTCEQHEQIIKPSHYKI